jgi:hypothetical protein
MAEQPSPATNRNSTQPKDITRIAEEAVLSNLRLQGWKDVLCDPNTREIQAKNPGGGLQLFRVKTAVAPNTPDSLSDSERIVLISKAEGSGAVAYQVKVQLGAKYAPARIQYNQL